MHAGRAAQWPTDVASSTQSPVQQSALRAQTSPSTRHPSSRPQRFIIPGPAGPHSSPQHSAGPPHASPAGLHGAEDAAHFVAAHAPLQQSTPAEQVAPAEAHGGVSAQVPTPSGRATHESEQHSPAKVQDAPKARHPTAAAQTGAGGPGRGHQPEQHCDERVQGAPFAPREQAPSSPAGASGGGASAKPSSLVAS